MKKTQQKTVRLWVWGSVGLLIAMAGFVLYSRLILPPAPIDDLFSILKEQGYQANRGFSGVFAPGNIVQLAEEGANGEDRTLPTPVIFLWGADCFPGETPRKAPFVLPQTKSGTSTASLTLGAEGLAKLVPSLQLDGDAVADYNLRIDDPLVYTFAKGDLSGHFSDKCVRAFDRQIRAGDKPSWFAIILDAVIAEKLVLDMTWKENVSAEARAKAAASAKNALAEKAEGAVLDTGSPQASVHLASEDKEHTVLTADGPVVIGYRTRSLMRDDGE
jgi:hypothetical protein